MPLLAPSNDLKAVAPQPPWFGSRIFAPHQVRAVNPTVADLGHELLPAAPRIGHSSTTAYKGSAATFGTWTTPGPLTLSVSPIALSEGMWIHTLTRASICACLDLMPYDMRPY